MATRSASRGLQATLQSAATTGNGNVRAIPSSFRQHQVSIIGSSGVSSGAIQVECADTEDYAGTWAPIGGGPVTVVASKIFTVDFTGIYKFIRARISTTVADGTVTCNYIGS